MAPMEPLDREGIMCGERAGSTRAEVLNFVEFCEADLFQSRSTLRADARDMIQMFQDIAGPSSESQLSPQGTGAEALSLSAESQIMSDLDRSFSRDKKRGEDIPAANYILYRRTLSGDFHRAYALLLDICASFLETSRMNLHRAVRSAEIKIRDAKPLPKQSLTPPTSVGAAPRTPRRRKPSEDESEIRLVD